MLTELWALLKQLIPSTIARKIILILLILVACFAFMYEVFLKKEEGHTMVIKATDSSQVKIDSSTIVNGDSNKVKR